MCTLKMGAKVFRDAIVSGRAEFQKIVEGKQPCWVRCSNYENVILQIVVMWYMLDVCSNRQYHTTKISALYDIADALYNPIIHNDKFDLATFYKTLEDAKTCYNNLSINLPEATNWLMTHTVTFGKKNGEELNEFTVLVVPDFVIEMPTESRTRIVMLRPQVSIMTMADVACTTLFIQRILSQPKTVDNKNARFCNTAIEVMFVDTSTGELFKIPSIPIGPTQVTSIILKQIRATMKARHTSIAYFCAFYKERKMAFEKYQHFKLCSPPYVERAVTYKGQKRKKGCEVMDYEEDLDNELEGDLEEFQIDAEST